MFANAKRPQTFVVVRKVKAGDKSSSNTHSRPLHPSSRGSETPAGPERRTINRASSSTSRSSHASRSSPQRLTVPPSRLKRKTKSPSIAHLSSSSDDDEDDAATNAQHTRKKLKLDGGKVLLADEYREVFEVTDWAEKEDDLLPILSSTQVVTDGFAKEYKPFPFQGLDEAGVISLQYPSLNCPQESYTLVQPKESLGYEPIEDVKDTIDMICNYYFPDEQSAVLSHEHTGILRRIKRALNHGSFDDFKAVIDNFNSVLLKALEDGTVTKTLQQREPALPLNLTERILDQIYSKTVSPVHKKLKQYENGTSNVYGELMPLFCHKIFDDTNLTCDQVFLDLGSGVGNVVLQAALQVGCESWGIEQMDNPAELADKQHQEFKARCQRWSIKCGKVNLLHGDFLGNPEIDAVIRRADVILINNEVFTPDTNDKLFMKLLDVKEGGKIVSLKTFVDPTWEITERKLNDPRNLFRVQKMQYFSSKYVSWTNKGGSYYIATMDSSRLKKFQERLQKKQKRKRVSDVE